MIFNFHISFISNRIISFHIRVQSIHNEWDEGGIHNSLTSVSLNQFEKYSMAAFKIA